MADERNDARQAGQLRSDLPARSNRWSILGLHVHAIDYVTATRLVLEKARQEYAASYICAANVHMVMEAYDSPDYRRTVNGADLVTADGMPLVWALRLLGEPGASRVYGPDLTERVLHAAAANWVPVGFYGSSPEVMVRLVAEVRKLFSGIDIPFAFSPPFHKPTAEEDDETVAAVNRSGARILFVGLGCPKQERWMETQSGRIRPVMLGVGAAFDFLAGTKPQAPRWVMRLGMEWGFRLITEPSRLWRRYLRHNPRFIALLTVQLIRGRKNRFYRLPH